MVDRNRKQLAHLRKKNPAWSEEKLHGKHAALSLHNAPAWLNQAEDFVKNYSSEECPECGGRGFVQYAISGEQGGLLGIVIGTHPENWLRFGDLVAVSKDYENKKTFIWNPWKTYGLTDYRPIYFEGHDYAIPYYQADAQTEGRRGLAWCDENLHCAPLNANFADFERRRVV